jgi:hypothetical protein
MSGSFRLRAMIACRVRARAVNRRAGRTNSADGIAAIVMHTVQGVIPRRNRTLYLRKQFRANI